MCFHSLLCVGLTAGADLFLRYIKGEIWISS